KGVLITGSKLKAFRNPQPSWGFSVHKKMALLKAPFSA
ncbi:penicillin-binding protein, partial [Escherichia coli]